MVAGALGWYFDTPQLHVVIDKFWAYADVNYRLDGRKLGDFTTYPIFNKYGSINLGEVAGGVRLFWTESVAGVINWSLAAPLFSINYVLLDAALRRSLRPIKTLLSPAGVEGLVEQGVRVLRWGLWMAPVINSFLRQSPDPTWYNQDGAIRTGVAIGANATQSPADFRQFSLAMFTGLLAYDWLQNPHLVRPYGAEGRDPGQSVLSRRRPGRRGGGAIRRPPWPHARHSGRHPPLWHLGAAAHSVLHPAWA